ncbi:MAG: hypothetical protein ACREBD_03205 [Blastocatellia bacterium]
MVWPATPYHCRLRLRRFCDLRLRRDGLVSGRRVEPSEEVSGRIRDAVLVGVFEPHREARNPDGHDEEEESDQGRPVVDATLHIVVREKRLRLNFAGHLREGFSGAAILLRLGCLQCPGGERS